MEPPQYNINNRYSPQRNYYEAINDHMSKERDPQIINEKLSPLIKDYKAKAIYEKMGGNYSPS